MIFKYYRRLDLLWTLQLSTHFFACVPNPCVMDWWSWNLIMIIIINLQTYHACLYSVGFASLLRTRGRSESPRSRVLHLRTSVNTSERRSAAVEARSVWRCCCCCPLPLLHRSLARSSVLLDTQPVKLTRATPGHVPVPFTERPDKHKTEFRHQRQRRCSWLSEL